MHLLKGEKQYPGFHPILKTVLFWAVFMLLYFAYKYFPVFPLSLICSINKSNFQHYKAAFFAFLILNLIEFAIYRRQIQDKKRHILSRLTATTFAPWIVFLLWYIAPAIYGKMPTIPLEIIYANIITLLVGYFVTSLEQGFATNPVFKQPEHPDPDPIHSVDHFIYQLHVQATVGGCLY